MAGKRAINLAREFGVSARRIKIIKGVQRRKEDGDGIGFFRTFRAGYWQVEWLNGSIKPFLVEAKKVSVSNRPFHALLSLWWF
jgi:hypothetical protein